MSVLWTATEAALATKGIVLGDWKASGVSIDSRTVKPGDLFIALSGPNCDGHDFVLKAFEAGAVAAMVHAPVPGAQVEKLLEVADTMAGLNGLARAARARSEAVVCGVTGSVGKTGVKEMLKLTLSRQGRTHATEGNLNNQWGLPLTLARMPRDTEFAVLEMGMNHTGEISAITRLARPNVAIVTAVEAAHTEFFPSVEDIARAKAEIFEGLEEDGVAILNRDTPHFDLMAACARKRGARVVGFGRHIDADLRLVARSLQPDLCIVHAVLDDQTLSYTLGVPGQHWALNSLAVLAAVQALGGDVDKAAVDLADMRAPKGRGQRHTVALGDGEVLVIDDSYNASPASIRAAFAVLAQSAPVGRKIAVLGDMLELGVKSPDLHASLAEAAKASGVDLVFTAGPLMERLHAALPEALRGGHAKDANAIIPLVRACVRAGDAVLVKGSAGSRMGAVVEALLNMNDTSARLCANGH